MTFVLFLLVTATMFLRPAEIVPDLQGWPIYEVLMVGTLLGSLEAIRRQLDVPALVRQPASLCVIGVFFAIMLSHATHGYVYGVRTSGEEFLRTMLYYLMLLSQINSPRRMRWLVFVVAVCATVMVLLCIVDYMGVVDFQFVNHVSDRDGRDDEGADTWVFRMCGTGIFEDPNDLSLVIVAAGILCFYFLNDESLGVARAGWLLPLAVLAFGLLCTRSRGGLLTAGASATVLLYYERGKWAALSVMLLGAIALPFVGGRQGEISLEAGTAAERLLMWKEGFEEMKSASFLFGIGAGLYSDIAGLVAHNSYVHAFVELGFFGGTLYFGCFFFNALALYRISTMRVSPETQLQLTHDPDLNRFVRLQPYVAAVLADWTVGTFTLSRCYVVPTYLVLGMACAYLTIWRRYVLDDRPVVVFDRPHFFRLVGSSAALLVGTYVLVRIYQR